MSSTRPVTRYSLAVACAALLLFAFGSARAQQYPQPPPPPPSGHPPPPAGYGGYAQPPPPQAAQPPFERRGWFAGFDFGFGSFRADGRFDSGDESGSVQFGAHFGGMIRPRIGLMVLFAGSSQPYLESEGYSDMMLSQFNLGIAVQYWASPKLWLKAGLASSNLSIEQEGEKLDEAEGGGVLGAIGYEFYRRGRFIIDGQVKFVAASHGEDGVEVSSTNTFGLLVGLNWY